MDSDSDMTYIRNWVV